MHDITRPAQILTSAEYQPAGGGQPAQAGDRQRVQAVSSAGGGDFGHWAVDDVDPGAAPGPGHDSY